MDLFTIGFIALRMLGLVFFGLLVARMAAGLRDRRRHDDGALASLERRFVIGEINEEDFRRMREVLAAQE